MKSLAWVRWVFDAVQGKQNGDDIDIVRIS